MLIRTIIFFVLSAGLIATPNAFGAKRILVITESKGFVHGVVKRPSSGELCVVESALEEIGKTSGLFETVNSQNAVEVLTADNLKNFDAIFFYTTGSILPEGEARHAFLNFVKSGKGFIGTHSATDTFADFKDYVSFINGNFDGHPWGAGTTETFTNHEPSHPVVKMWPAEFQFKDEIYQYKGYDPNAVRVLLSMNMAGTNPKMPYHVPVCWVREYGQGRVFYTNLGHNESTWKDERYRAHLLSGIHWILKMEDAPTKPNPDVQAIENAKGFCVFAAPMVNREWNDLLARASKKITSSKGFAEKLNAQIAEFRKMPTGDPKKEKPEELEALKAKRNAFVKQIVETIEQ
jgi:type 1 glutamine amidotransferase